MQVDWFTLLLIFLAWTVLAIISRLLGLERYGVEVYPLAIMLKSQSRIKRILYKFVEKNKKIIDAYSKFSIRMVFILIVVSFIYLLINGGLLLARKLGISTVVLGEFQFIFYMHFNTVKLLILSLAIFLAVFPHEISHALIGLKNGMKIEEIGFFNFMGIFFGGYVEFDQLEPETFIYTYLSDSEKQVHEVRSDRNQWSALSEYLKKIREVSAAGLGANIIFLMIIIGLILATPLISITFYKQNGVYVVDIMEDSPAETYGLKPGIIIYAVNNTPVDNISSFIKLLESAKGNMIILVTNQGNISVKVPPDGKLGIIIMTYYEPKYKFLPSFYDFLFFVQINFSIQLAIIILNAVPIFISDGARYTLMFLIEKTKSFEKAQRINFILNMIGISLLLLNIILSM